MFVSFCTFAKALFEDIEPSHSGSTANATSCEWHYRFPCVKFLHWNHRGVVEY